MRNLKDTVGDMQAEEFEELLEEAGMMDLLEKVSISLIIVERWLKSTAVNFDRSKLMKDPIE